MASGELLKPTLHVEVRLKSAPPSRQTAHEVCVAVKTRLIDDYVMLEVGQNINSFDDMKHAQNIICIEIADYTGPASVADIHSLAELQLDVKSYVLKGEQEPGSRRSIQQVDDDAAPHVKILALPNVSLHEAWSSLVFEDALPARLLRYLVRMVDMMSQPDLNLSAFNWNRLCLLHGPPGSGKSTLCRALAQKLSIRLSNAFTNAKFAEINTNSLLSKYFGESGKQIGSMFEQIYAMCQDRKTLVCVVMDEVETIAGSRERVADGAECSDGLRATNQLLTALDRLRNLPNVIVLCTSNLIEAIDPAFLDRVDIKQFVPSPSPPAIYNIFRSCLNELVRSSLVDTTGHPATSHPLEKSSTTELTKRSHSSSSSKKPTTRTKTKPAATEPPQPTVSSSPEAWDFVTSGEQNILTFAEIKFRSSINANPKSMGQRVWDLAQKCQGFSGRTLRRLPILGLAMYTWGGECSLGDAVSALEKAVEQELAVSRVRKEDVEMAEVDG